MENGALRVVTQPSRQAPDDGELMRAFLAGDRAAFAELVRRHQRPVLAVVRRYTASGDEAAELAQRAFVRALEAGPRGLGAEVPFRAWVLRIALNLAKNQVRDARRRALADGARVLSAPVAVASAEASIEAAQLARRVRLAVLNLPRRQREVLTLRLDAELSFGEIGAALGISENAAKVNFHHAVARLRELTRSEDER